MKSNLDIPVLGSSIESVILRFIQSFFKSIEYYPGVLKTLFAATKIIFFLKQLSKDLPDVIMTRHDPLYLMKCIDLIYYSTIAPF